MSSDPKIKPVWLAALLAFLGWSLVFGLIYAQSPLYTSNQNTYFLHGLAQAGFGYLSHDWLASTQELMPVFSGVVYLTYLVFHTEIPSYAYYALLMGVYLFSMYGIMDTLFNLRRSRARTLAFTTLFLVFHSAALRFVLSRGVDPDATFLFEGGVAGQRILGQVFQPSAFGVFLTLSIYLFLRKRYYWSLVPMAVAIYFHPVYLLAGAFLTIAYIWILWREGRNLKTPFLLGLASLLLAAPSVAYTAYINWSSSPAVAAQVLDILVNFRNPHHALITSWLDWTVAVKVVILLAALFFVRRTRLFPILVIVTLGILLLTAAQVVTASNTLALLFPWRVSILLVPLSLAALIAFTVTRIMDIWNVSSTVSAVLKPRKPAASKIKDVWKAPGKNESWIIGISLLLITALIAVGVMRFQIEVARLRSGAARPMMAWVAANRTSADVYLIPPKMADFRLVTGTPVYVDFETAPDRSDDVLEWYRRLQLVFAFYNGQTAPCQALQNFAENEGLTLAVVTAGDPDTACSSLPVVYADAAYVIYAIK
jgi:hypothetical protein